MSPLDKLRALIQRLTPGGGMAERTVKSGAWLAGQNVVGRALQLGFLAVLARVIGPGELGLVGIGLLTLSATKRFTKIGLNHALIQKVEDDVDSHLNTTWMLEIGRGVLISGVLLLAAPFVAGSFFGEPRAVRLIQVLGLSPLLLGFRNPGIVYFRKDLEFHKEFVYKIGGDIAQFVVGVGYAMVHPTAWAFVFGFVAADVTKFFISYAIHGYRPYPSFDVDVAKELIDYGKWLTGSSILYFLYSEGDDAFVGWFLTPTALAYYQYTYRFSNAPATELSQVVTSVMFPAFSKLQTDPEQLRNAFGKTIRMSSFVAFPSAIGIAAVAPEFILTVFGEEWTPAIPAMQVLAFYGLMRAIGKTFGPVWEAIGRPDYVTKMSAIRVVLIAIFIYPMTDAFGIVGTALTVTGIFVFPMLPLDIYITSRAIDIPVRSIVYEFVYPFLASVPMGLVVWSLGRISPFGAPVTLVLLIAVGAVVFSVNVLALQWVSNWNVTNDFQRIYRNLAA
ncbi:lipopolysaccharide biosynthesis protein [Halorubrum sp. 48-1-W]|uniref:lipopolysaccharide biosynthesis protein n=1 Tax=Halorubrum sp. 48-1-W TaxID=2249761 RepID=UPI000DCBFB01|nr:lipopolysaccharide biosynthesis protein [Halorubrum sp. 48-1-W]RAW45623.1 lipopolysaccharide biosynthesis protein [Halorubrum sp. 48-1-W]